MKITAIHAPERQAHETQVEYRSRQRASKRHHQKIALSGPYRSPGRNTGGSRQNLRDLQRRNGSLFAGLFGAGLREAITRKNLADIAERKAKALRLASREA
jgi:hypothetical protein